MLLMNLLPRCILSNPRMMTITIRTSSSTRKGTRKGIKLPPPPIIRNSRFCSIRSLQKQNRQRTLLIRPILSAGDTHYGLMDNPKHPKRTLHVDRIQEGLEKIVEIRGQEIHPNAPEFDEWHERFIAVA